MEFKEFSLAKVGGIIKKNPVLFAGGLVVVIGGLVWYNNSDSSGETIDYAAGTTESASESETSDELDLTALEEDILSKLEDNQEKRFEEFADTTNEYLGSYLSDMFAGFEGQIANYTEQYEVAAPMAQEETMLQKQISNILSTDSLLLETGYNYTAEDIAGMSNWASEEKKAITSGTMGTSKNTKLSSGTKVTYNKDNTVSFGSGKSISTGAALGSENYSSSRTKVSNITKKSGSIESQLSGKTQSEKMSTLKAAGLI